MKMTKIVHELQMNSSACDRQKNLLSKSQLFIFLKKLFRVKYKLRVCVCPFSFWLKLESVTKSYTLIFKLLRQKFHFLAANIDSSSTEKIFSLANDLNNFFFFRRRMKKYSWPKGEKQLEHFQLQTEQKKERETNLMK